MKQLIPVNKKKCIIAYKITFFEATRIRVIAFDPEIKNAIYTNQVFETIKPGVDYVRIPLPIAPENLVIEIFNEQTGKREDTYKIESVSCLKLSQKNNFDAKTKEFIDFLSEFVEYAGDDKIIPAGEYVSSKYPFGITYMNGIFENGYRQFTPARIDRNSWEIQIDRLEFIHYTIPMRFIIGAHEYYHNYLDSDNETECDLKAVEMALNLGFPKIEMVYAFTKIFNESDVNIERATKIFDFINNWKEK